LQVKVLISTKV